MQTPPVRIGVLAPVESCSWRWNREAEDDPGEEREPQMTPASDSAVISSPVRPSSSP